MLFKKVILEGCFVLMPKIFIDERGSFFESFNQQKFEQETGVKVNFVQENQSISKRGIVRGLHFQKGEFAQAKLVRVIKGKVLDVVVDLRPNSKTYGKHFSIELSGENKLQMYVPRGFAHGFSVLEDDTIFAYKCDNFYHKEAEGGIIYNDPMLNIDWKLPENEIILSKKDKQLKMLKKLK